MRRSPGRLTDLFFSLVLSFFALRPGLAAEDPVRRLPRLALGYKVPAGGAAGAVGPLAAEAATRPEAARVFTQVVLNFSPPAGESPVGLVPLLTDLQRAGHKVVLRLSAGSPPAPLESAVLESWMREVARQTRGLASGYAVDGVWPAEVQEGWSRQAALAIKTAAITLRGENPEAAVAVAAAAADGPQALASLLALAPELEAYIDAVLLTGCREESFANEIRRARETLLPLLPGASFWAEVPLSPALSGTAYSEEVAARGFEALAAGADLAFFDLPSSGMPGPGGRSFPAAAEVLLRLGKTLDPSLGLLSKGAAGVEAGEGLAWFGLFDEEDFQEWIVFWAARRPPGNGARGYLLLDQELRRNFRLHDPLTGEEGPAPVVPAGANRVRVEVPFLRRPLALLISRARGSEGFLSPPGSGEVSAARPPTTDEIIAGHQAWRGYQDDRLEHYTREAEISFRLRVAQVSSTFDLTLRAGEFWDRPTGAEWVIRETFFNGARLGWDKVPELPFVSREKVVAVPLDLNLDRRYAYELEGEEAVEGRRAWRLRFAPLTGSVSLYRGRAWIDQATGALLKVTTIETKLTAPLIASEETQLFGPFPGPDGTTFWLPRRLDGQQIYTVSGANVVVLRQILFGKPAINDPGFAALRREAYASPRQMLRDTPEGYKWLARTADGGREVQPKGDTRQTFLLAGVLHDGGTGGVIPLAGVNYTDIDFLGRGRLFNVFFAGALANLTLSDPGFAGTRLDLGLTVNAVGFGSRERQYTRGEENEAERVRRVAQTVRITAGYPLGRHFKLRAALEGRYNNFQKDDDTEDFILPADHWLRAANLELGFDRGGWGFSVESTRSSRAAWKPWGPKDRPATPAQIEKARSFSSWEAAGRKSWFLPRFQKIEVRARYQEGEDFDRFSSFRFGFLGGERVRGFGGSGIRFDRGWLAGAEYSFNLAEILRFDLTIDHARVHDPQLGTGLSSHTGLGLAANFVGPWRTLWRLDTGYAWKSDLPAAEGGTEVLVSFLRLF